VSLTSSMNAARFEMRAADRGQSHDQLLTACHLYFSLQIQILGELKARGDVSEIRAQC
jgi:hypothetical protein